MIIYDRSHGILRESDLMTVIHCPRCDEPTADLLDCADGAGQHCPGCREKCRVCLADELDDREGKA